MKVSIPQKVLLEVLEKGAVAALSQDAQEDTSSKSLLFQAIKITVTDKHFTIESSTPMISVKYGVTVSEENGINLKEAGCVVIPAKKFINWVGAQGKDSTVGINLQKLQTPEIINTAGDLEETDDAESSKFFVNKIGTVKLASRDANKTNAKWEVDCYDPDQMLTVNYGQKAEKYFDIQASTLTEAINNVLFASLKKDVDHVLDSISVQTYEGNVYFSTTDMHRCALYMIPKDNLTDIQSSKSLLIPCMLMEQASKILNKEDKVSFSYSEESNKVFLSQPNLKIRLTSTERERINKFPSIEVLLKKPYKSLADVSKDVLNSLLINAAVVNSSSALFIFSKADGTFTVKAISEENKYKPAIKESQLTGISKDVKAVWGVSHLLEGLKAYKNDVSLSLPDNLKSLKITGKDGTGPIYFVMSISNSKYQAENE